MPTLADRIMAVSDLNRQEAEHLRSLCTSWQVLADLAFSDLFLYVKVRGSEEFEIAAQIRPFTSQTLYPDDMVGTRVTQPENPIVERAFREGQIWKQDEPVLVDGLPVRMDAVPARFGGEVIGVITKEGNPATSRRPGLLEEVYLEAAEHVSEMIAAGTFPWPDSPPGDWPRVGDGLFRLDADGQVTWASPNGLSSMRRLGLKQDILGRNLDEFDIIHRPVDEALKSLKLVDGEIVRGGTHVFMRVMPLVRQGTAMGAIVLTRDVSELREKERLLSVKDATIREIHHRVKNNLQTIASLLRLQARRLKSEEGKAALNESVLRIASIAVVHETLSEDPSDVAEFGEVARRISRMIGDGLMLPDRSVRIDVSGQVGSMGAEIATPLAVTVTELVQNAIEHAFEGRDSGTVRIELERTSPSDPEIPEDIVVSVVDDGVGIGSDSLKGSRLGLQIVRSLIEELGGTFSISPQEGGGTVARVSIPAGGR